MIKRPSYNHVSVAIVMCENSSEALFDQYDETYPHIDWRLRLNLIGGNHSKIDLTPLDILKREIEEEFSSNIHQEKEEEEIFKHNLFKNKKELAPLKDIIKIKEDIIKNCEPYKDFYISIPKASIEELEIIKEREERHIISSVFLTYLKKENFQIAKVHLANGKAIKNEGYSKIINLEDIEKEKLLTASGTGAIIEDYYQEKNKVKLNISNPDNIGIEYIGKPRKFLVDYLEDYDYHLPIRKK